MVSAIYKQGDVRRARVLVQSLRERLKIVYSLHVRALCNIKCGRNK